MGRISLRGMALVFGVLGLALLYLAPDIASRTMMLDGVLYSGIANVAAHGDASLWFPPHFHADLPSFHDHPPLGLGILTLWFKVFGGSFWVENLFTVLVLVIIGGLMILHWRLIESEPGSDTIREQEFWPLFIFFLMPVTTFAIKNNPLEAMLCASTLAAVLAAHAGRKNLFVNMIVGLLALVAILIKGPVGMFPLVAPFLFSAILDLKIVRGIIGSTIATVTLISSLGVLLIFEGPGRSLAMYVDTQLLATMSGERLVEYDRIYQIKQMTINVCVGSLIVALAYARYRQFTIPRAFWTYLALGLAVFLPLLISPRHYKHYLLPGLPYFAIALALVVRPDPRQWRTSVCCGVAVLLLLAAGVRITAYWGDDGKDAPQIQDAHAIARHVNLESVTFCDDFLQRRAYLMRYHGIRSRKSSGENVRGYYVCNLAPEGHSFDYVGDIGDEHGLWIRR